MGLFKKKNKNIIYGTKYDMFKNINRKNRLHASNKGFSALSSLSVTVFFGAVISVALAMVYWLLTSIITLGLAAKQATITMGKWMNGSIAVAGIALIVFVVTFIARFVFEWLIILAETNELKKQPEENAKYITVSEAVKKATVTDLIYSAIVLAILVVGALLAYNVGGLDKASKGGGVNVFVIVVSVIIVIVGIVVWRFKAKKHKAIYQGVRKEVEEIRQERLDLKQEKIEAKAAAKREKKATKNKE